MKDPLFFIAVLPDHKISEEVTRFKKYAAEHFDTSRALRSPPHVTLFPPFMWPTRRVEELCRAVETFAGGHKQFAFPLSGFDCFSPRVIFIRIGESEPLAALQHSLRDHLAVRLQLKRKDNRPFHPHLTVAFKDLRRSVFPKAWAHFSEIDYQRTFVVDSLTLLQHNGQEWEVFQNYPLMQS